MTVAHVVGRYICLSTHFMRLTLKVVMQNDRKHVDGTNSTGRHVVAQLVEALPYKPKVAVSISDSVTGNFYWHKPSGLTMTLGSTHSLKLLSIRQPVRTADKLTASLCRLSWNLGVSTSGKPQRLYKDFFSFFKILQYAMWQLSLWTSFAVRFRTVFLNRRAAAR